MCSMNSSSFHVIITGDYCQAGTGPHNELCHYWMFCGEWQWWICTASIKRMNKTIIYPACAHAQQGVKWSGRLSVCIYLYIYLSMWTKKNSERHFSGWLTLWYFGWRLFLQFTSPLDRLDSSVALSARSNPAVSLQLLLKRTVSHTHIIELRSDHIVIVYIVQYSTAS